MVINVVQLFHVKLGESIQLPGEKNEFLESDPEDEWDHIVIKSPGFKMII